MVEVDDYKRIYLINAAVFALKKIFASCVFLITDEILKTVIIDVILEGLLNRKIDETTFKDISFLNK